MIQRITTVVTRYNLKSYEVVETKIDVIEKEEFKQFLLNLNQNSLKSLEEGKAVYFHKSAVYPRKKFKVGFPNNPIVRDVEDADIVIFDISKLISMNMLYFYKYTKYLTGWKFVNSLQEKGIPTTQFAQILYSSARGMSVVERLEEIDYLTKKSYLDINYLDIPARNELDEETYNMISSMMKSNRVDMQNLAMRMLTGIKYAENKSKIGLFFCDHWIYWRNVRDKKISVEIKTLINKVANDFPGFDTYSKGKREALQKILMKNVTWKNDM